MANNTKQQAINTFTGGLNTDLHPLTTPNDILTDCINGTVITYNGNEYILQNDMGNYKLDKAKLYADYIPIGIKEYGNIIYIVSYNPIDKKCQIGSYPSPQTLFDNSEYGSKTENYQGVPTYTLDPDWTWPTDPNSLINDGIVNLKGTSENPATDVLFTNTKPNQNLRVFFPADSLDLKDTFLNPGDKYYLKKEEGEDSRWKFQRCEYYTLTESKEALPIEEGLVISDPDDYAPEKLRNVTWETPGWLAYKPSLIEPASFDLYLTDIKIPSFLTSTSTRQTGEGTGKLSFNVQGQLTINTTGDWKDYYDNLKVYFDYSYAGGSWKNDWDNGSHVNSEENGTPTNYGNTIDILTFNNQKSLDISKEAIENNKTVVIRATPYIIDDTYGIVYDNLAVTYTINLGELYSINEIETFSIYKYLSDDEGVTINFSIISPTSNLSQITCKYRIHEIGNEFKQLGKNTDYQDIDSLNLLGQNILTINYGTENKNDWFQKEEIYIFELGFFNIKDWEVYIKALENHINYPDKYPDKPTIKPIHCAAEFLITSELFNTFYSEESRYQDIKLTEWTSRIKSNITINKNIENFINDDSKYIYNKYISCLNPNELLNIAFYMDEEGNMLTEDNFPKNNFILDLSQSEVTAATKVINRADLSKNAYYGCMSTHITNLKYHIPAPLILNTNKGMWADVTWDSVVSSSVILSENGKQVTYYNPANEIPYLLKTKLLKNEDNPVDTSVYTIYTKAELAGYISDKYEGKDGSRWYLYKNLFIKFSEEWKIKELITNIPETFWTEENLKELEKKTLVAGGLLRRAYRITTWTDSSNNHTLAGLIETDPEENFDFNTLQLQNKDKRYNQGRQDDGNKLMQLVDDYVTNNDFGWTFVPVSPTTTVGTTRTSRGWYFGDVSADCTSGKGNFCSGIGIICKASVGGSKTVAVINFMPVELTSFKGAFTGINDRFGVNNKVNKESKWLVASNKISAADIFKVNDEYTGNQYMHQCVGALLFGLGIQLYGVYDLHIDYKNFLKHTDSNIRVYSENLFTVNYKRTDTLNSIFYKGINIKKDLSNLNLDQLFSSININPKFYSTTNLSNGTFAHVTISSKTNNYQYIDAVNAPMYSTTFTSFISQLNALLQKEINNWLATRNYSENKVYCDLESTTVNIDFVKFIGNSLRFEYNNDRGNFYYANFPEAVWFSRKNNETRSGFVRGIDWGNAIIWNNVSSILVPSPEFKKRELNITNNGENKTNR